MKLYHCLFILAPVILIAGLVLAQDDAPAKPATPPIGNPDITPESTKAVNKGLDYLHSRLTKSGRFGEQYYVAATSLVGLSFLAGGHLPAEGKYGDSLKGALKYIIRCQNSAGYIAEPDQITSRMHGHGFATWFLAELYGMTKPLTIDKEEIKSALKKAVKVIESSQSREGGWYYEPKSQSDEGSVTVCIVQALRAARNVGITVDQNIVQNGITYLQKSSNPDGSFKYSLHSNYGEGSFALAAGGVSSLCLYGKYDAPETTRGLAFLMKFKPGSKNNWNTPYPYYANFYGALAMHLAGDKYWKDWFPPLRDHLIKIQSANGAWQRGEACSDYSTALACLMLQIPYQYLPLFQK